MSVFSTVVCGVDGSSEGEVAARIAALVVDSAGELVLTSVEDLSIAAHAGYGAGHVLESIDADARRALETTQAAATMVHPAATSLRVGSPVNGMLEELEHRGATLAVVGMREHTRAPGILLGAVSTFLLHEAPCSVLVTREPADLDRWPRSIVVGLDCSDEAAAALTVARELAHRFGSSLRTVVATECDADVLCAQLTDPDVETFDGRPVDVLAVFAEGADLVCARQPWAEGRPRARQRQRACRARGEELRARRAWLGRARGYVSES